MDVLGLGVQGRGVWSVADGRRERGSMDRIGKGKKKRIGDQCKLQAAAFAFSLLLASALLLICFSRTHPNTCSNKIHISTFLPLSFLCFLLKKNPAFLTWLVVSFPVAKRQVRFELHSSQDLGFYSL